MKSQPRNPARAAFCRVLACLFSAFVLLPEARAADFTVTAPGFFYVFTSNSVAISGQNPTLTLTRGKTYTFAVNSPGHPFQILGAPVGAVLNNNVDSATVTFAVPTNAASYSYQCSIHLFGGNILTAAPPAPPVIRLTSVTLGSNVVLKSTGTNTFNVIPQYITNIVSTNWVALTVQTNTFANGTNTTICTRPPEPNVFIRIQSFPN